MIISTLACPFHIDLLKGYQIKEQFVAKKREGLLKMFSFNFQSNLSATNIPLLLVLTGPRQCEQVALFCLMELNMSFWPPCSEFFLTITKCVNPAFLSALWPYEGAITFHNYVSVASLPK